MKLIASLSTLAIARLDRVLRSVHALLSASMRPPRLVPIPIRVDRRTSDVTDRPSRRRY
jgi:hypothetical protein